MEALYLTGNRNSPLILIPMYKDLGISVFKCLDIPGMIQVQVAQGNVFKIRGIKLELFETLLEILLRGDIFIRKPVLSSRAGPVLLPIARTSGVEEQTTIWMVHHDCMGRTRSPLRLGL